LYTNDAVYLTAILGRKGHVAKLSHHLPILHSISISPALGVALRWRADWLAWGCLI
jgi:hypothetical protein